MPHVLRRATVGIAAIIAVTGCGRAAGAPAAAASAPSPEVVDGLGRLRAATAPLRVLDSAVAVGYARAVPDCLVHEHHGAMGYHHSNPRYVDAKVEVERPEILLYERLPDGGYRLNGVEFIVPYRAWPRDSVAPLVMGQKLKREDNLKIWYLHVWAWTPNKEGVFADFHPDVTCPTAASKVFRPFAGPPGESPSS